ncbi:hypothetical protein [Raineyella sp. W15-4]|uniref:hypothetical protein n=1 Tax=Raineyella sp. W15-4 TaxID=3081651 RepID=UPI0029537AE0|nr:hypothetical protein [Raineyella sp. W15-4]WOQ15473.1 hypothetical protein R0145_09415 [Raineyella sp. W15-4]
MTADSAPEDPTPDSAAPGRPARARWPWPVVVYVLAAVLLGGAGGVVWRTTTPLPGYTVQPDGQAVISELALTQLFVADARYAVIGLVGGLLLGLLAVAVLRRRGWWVVVWAAAAPILAGLAAWGAGVVGAVPLKDRIAHAVAGQSEPVDLALHSPVAVLLWPFAAMLVVLLWSAFAPEPARERSADREPSADRERSVQGADGGDPGVEQPDQVVRGDLELE